MSNEERLVVKRGPFKGIVYPSAEATGSALWPKILGMYEYELQDVINKSLSKKYGTIVDVGCAEGYYIIGYAIKQSADKYIAYDIDDNAQRLCNNMAKANNVDIDIRRFCSPDELMNIGFAQDKPNLLICDCEGYERELFCEKVVDSLKNVDMIIEIHDWCQDEMRTEDYIKYLFEETHNISVCLGIDDYEKAYTYKVEELEGKSIVERFRFFAEGRRRLGKWLYLEAKNGHEDEGIVSKNTVVGTKESREFAIAALQRMIDQLNSEQ